MAVPEKKPAPRTGPYVELDLRKKYALETRHSLAKQSESQVAELEDLFRK